MGWVLLSIITDIIFCYKVLLIWFIYALNFNFNNISIDKFRQNN